MFNNDILLNNPQESLEFFAHKLSNSFTDINTFFLERLYIWLSSKASKELIHEFTVKTHSLNHLLHIFKHKTTKNLLGKIVNLKIIFFMSEEEFFYEKIVEKCENIDDILLALLENIVLNHKEISPLCLKIIINFCLRNEKIKKKH